MKKLALLLSAIMILLLASCAPAQDNSAKKSLSEMLTSHKWRYSLQEGGAMKLSYKWLLELKDDGTWAMDMDNSVDDESASHTLRGTWKLDGKTLTVVMKDEEISEFNTTEVLEFADDLTDEKIEKDGIIPEISTNPNDNSTDDLLNYSPQTKWYVSDKYFCFYTFLFTAE